MVISDLRTKVNLVRVPIKFQFFIAVMLHLTFTKQDFGREFKKSVYIIKANVVVKKPDIYQIGY